ncbi:unnamed protein product [Symbiodinium sp. CCMP2592]|nr:unnamed protein product [Symbiodinium sp. CCMP2592]
MHLDDPDLLHNINRVIREMGLVGKAVTFRMDQEAALGALAEKLTKCDSSPASATLIDVVPGYRPQSKGSIERQVETMKQGFWSVWLDLEKEVAKVKQETEVSKSKAHHDKFRGARTVKAVYLGPVHAKGGGIFANQEVVNDEGDMEIDRLTNHYLESLFRGPDLRATSTAVAKSFDLKFGGTKIRCAVPQNAVSETSGEKLEPDLLYASMKLELEELESFKVGEVIPEREARRLAKENGRRVLTSRWVNTVKKKGLYRSRLVVRDYASMGGTTLSEGIYSPTTSLEGLRLLLSMLCRRGSVLSCDVSVAFMHAPVARAEFVELPNNVSTQGTGERVFVKLRKAMNGLRSAPLSWYCELAEYLRSQNFEASLDPTIFRRLTRKGLTIVLFYVDDLLIYSEDEAEGRRFYEELRKRYKLKLTGELIQDCPGEVSFLGRRIFRRKKGERTVYFGLDEQYLSSCCEEYGITKPAPKLPSLERRYAELLKKGQTELISPAAHERYRRTLGRLAWAALSRPDLQFVCGFLGRHQAAPDEAAETCMRDVLRWVKGLPHKVQRFPSKREILEDDADPASVAREGLYIALLVETIREGMPKDRETGYYVLKGYSDSESAVCISKMQTLLRKVRHIELRAAFLQELVARGRFTIEHIPGVINPADALTKSPTNESLSSLYDASGLVDEPKAWESEPTEVHVSFEEPNENERFTPSVPPSWKAAALKLARGEAKYVVVELCCEEGSALSKACSKVPEIAYFGVTKEVDLLSYNGLCLLREVFGVVAEGEVKVYAHLSTPCSAGCGLRHLRFKKGGKALEKWRAALAVHKRSWKRIEKLLEPYVGSPNLLLSHEWPERSGLWDETVFKRVSKKLRLDQGCLVDRCCFEKGDQRPWKRWWFVSNRTEFVWGLSSQCSEGHGHYYLPLPESGVYPEGLGFALLKNAKKTFEENEVDPPLAECTSRAWKWAPLLACFLQPLLLVVVSTPACSHAAHSQVDPDGRTKGKGKGEGKGSKNPPGGKVGAVLAGLWKDLPEAAQKAFQEVGYSPPRPKGPPPPPPGLDLQSLLKGRMTEKEYNAARAVVYAGAGLHVQTLLEAAGIPPPPDEDLDRPEPTPQEKLTRCVSDFKKATNQMKNLVEKKAKLQARADKLKQELEKLIGDVDQVDKDIKAKDVEIQETAKAFKEMTADSTSTAFSALEAVLSEAGHELNEATRAKMKAALVGKEDLPPDPFIVSFRGHDEYFPREMPPMYGPARTDPHGKRPTPLEGTKPEGAAGSDNPE